MSKKKKTKKIHQPDDKFFKKILSQPKNAKAYIEEFYPEIAEIADLDNLVLQSESFIDDDLDLFFSDIVYRCPFKNSEELLNFSFVFEHKLKPEKWISIQLGLYILLALYRMVKENGREVEPVIPLLFYNGKEKWQPKTIYQLFEKHTYSQFIKPFLPNFSFLFKNVVDVNKEELLQIQISFFRSAMMAMAYRHNFGLIIRNINIIFEETNPNEFKLIFNYLFTVTKPTPEQMQEVIQNLKSPKASEKARTGWELLSKELEEIGIRKGEEIGIRKGEEIGIRKGEEIGIRKGEEIGIRKGEEIGIRKGKAIQTVNQLLNLINTLPNLSPKELSKITKLEERKIKLLIKVLPSNSVEKIANVLKKQFLDEFDLKKEELKTLKSLVKSIL